MDLLKFAAVIVCLVGLVIYALATNPKFSRIGEIMFGFGLLVTLAKL